jgi:hypothetical protein
MNGNHLCAALVVGLMLICTPAAAERVSLAGIDAKLDQLLNPIDPNRHVTIRASVYPDTACGRDRAFLRVNLDGTLDPDEFVVPNGFTLMLYDISWQAFAIPTSFVAGRTLRLALNTSTPAGNATQTVYFSPKIDITTTNQNSRPGASESLRAGVAIGEGRIVCANVSSSSQSGSSGHTVTEAVMRGILLENP